MKEARVMGCNAIVSGLQEEVHGLQCGTMTVTHVPVSGTSAEVRSQEGNIQKRLQERLRIQEHVIRYRDVRGSRVQILQVTELLLCCS